MLLWNLSPFLKRHLIGKWKVELVTLNSERKKRKIKQ